jgi:L-threonylcarbamoyladenylate synthase
VFISQGRCKESWIKKFLTHFMNLRQDIWQNKNLVKVLKSGGVAVMPTDTLYGIVGRAEDRETVDRIYKIRKRSPQKPCIILIQAAGELQNFGIRLTLAQKNEIEKLAAEARPTSFILDCPDEAFSYLHRGTQTLAFRIPAQADLKDLLKQTGPLIAPSANLEGEPPAKNIKEAQNYFGDKVDLYIDGGELVGQASKVIELHKDGSVSILRK